MTVSSIIILTKLICYDIVKSHLKNKQEDL